MQANELVRVVAAQVKEGEDFPIGVFACAIPYFFVWLTAVCVERRDLGVLREFLLRSMQTGFHHSTQIAGFLGLQAEDVQPEIDELVEDLFVARDQSDRLVLMEKGLRAISAQGLTRTVMREIPCIVNGISREVELRNLDLSARRRLSSDLLILPAIPSRPPRIQELAADAVKRALAISKTPLPRLVELARLGKVVRSRALYQQGYLMIWSGRHSVPLLWVNGVSENELARSIGGHPALQMVKSAIEGHARNVKRIIGVKSARLKGAAPGDAQVIRNALCTLVAASDADPAKRLPFTQSFVDAVKPLISKPHWVTSPIAQVLFAYAVFAAKTRLVVVASAESQFLLDLSSLETLKQCRKRGVEVVLHVPAGANFAFGRDGSVNARFTGIELVPLASNSPWCGFGWDRGLAVFGMCKRTPVSMGICDLFYGALTIGADSEELLHDMATRSTAPVTVKRRTRKLSAPS